MYKRSRLLFAAFAMVAGAVAVSPVAASDNTADAEVEPGVAEVAEDNFAGDDYLNDAGGLNPDEVAAGCPGECGNVEAVNAEDGYVWHAFGGSDATYPGDGSSTWRYNPSGDDIIVDRTAVGKYVVTFVGTTWIIPTVTAYSDGSINCNLETFSTGGPSFTMGCYDSAGNPADSPFSARVTATTDDATLWVSAAGAISACCTNNPFGGAPSVTKTGVGSYTVTTPGGPGFEGGHVQVTAYGFNSSDHCKVSSWSSTQAFVRCYDSSGALADENFTFLRVGTNDDAYVWANDATSTTDYTTSTFYSHNPQGNDPTAIKQGTGEYRVSFPGHLVSYGGNITVTAYGLNSVKCSVSSWGTSIAFVRCTDSSGNPADSRFNVLFTRFQVCEGVPANIEIGNNVPTNGDDVIIGTPGPDVIFAGSGNDRVCGEGGDDLIVGQNGNDVIFGGDGNDVISGNADNDTIYGGDGDDEAFAGSGNDLVFGGDGDDLLGGSSGFDGVYGEEDNDRINGGSDADGLINGGNGNDAVNGGGGDDNNVTGGNGDDTVSGNGGNDVITGASGDDEVRGGPGDDLVFGGPDNDFVAGNDGVDSCDGQGGTDTAAGNCELVLNVP